MHPSSSSPPHSLSPFARLKDKLEERRGQRKVDFYMKQYGFVPKNVMTEAEWKRAKKQAPTVEKKIDWGSSVMFGPPNDKK